MAYPHELQVERRTGKVRRPETDVLPLSHATNQPRHQTGQNTKIASFHSYNVSYFTTFNQSLLDFFDLVDLRLILMPMSESLKLYKWGLLLSC